MSFDVQQLTTTMTDAARTALSDRWPQVRSLAETELEKLAQTLDHIRRLYAAGEIDQQRARTLLTMQKNSARSVLLTIEGVAAVTAESVAIIGANAVGGAVNELLGFPLIPQPRTLPGESTPVNDFKMGRDL